VCGYQYQQLGFLMCCFAEFVGVCIRFLFKVFLFGNRFDVEGYVTGFGNPDWARTHPAATSTAPAVLAVLRGGATCVGKTVLDEMAYRLVLHFVFWVKELYVDS
jgi:hypothetical protein